MRQVSPAKISDDTAPSQSSKSYSRDSPWTLSPQTAELPPLAAALEEAAPSSSSRSRSASFSLTLHPPRLPRGRGSGGPPAPPCGGAKLDHLGAMATARRSAASGSAEQRYALRAKRKKSALDDESHVRHRVGHSAACATQAQCAAVHIRRWRSDVAMRCGA